MEFPDAFDGPSVSDRRGSGRVGDAGRRDCPGPIELILYVRAESAASANAIATIERVLSRYRSDDVTLTICELRKNPSTGTSDGIAPPLVTCPPRPRTFILGHSAHPDLLIEMLAECGGF